MSKSWTREYPRTANLPTTDSFNKDYDAHKGSLNGGVDRTNLGQQAVGRAQFVANAFHRVVLQTDVKLPSEFTTSNGGSGDFKCLEYDYYVGGWRNVAEYTLTGLHEGMMFAEFSCWAWVYPFKSVLNPKAVAWRLLFNGQIVSKGNGWYPEFSNPYISAQFPVPGGSGTLTLQWKYSAPDSAVDGVNSNQMYFNGGSLLAIIRWR